MLKEIKFGVDGWRAIIAEEFTYENVRIASRGIGRFILENQDKNLPVLIGYDPRFLADDFAKTCASELISLDLKVLLSDNIIPTPAIAYLAAKIKSNGAIQFTASHNPPKYCGLKYITNYGGPAPVEITDEITKHIKEETNKLGGKHIQQHISTTINILTFNPKEQYFSHIKDLVDFNVIKKAKLKVVYDPMHGAGCGYLDYLLKEAQCETITIHDKRDPLFSGLLPDPREEFLNDLKKSVLSNKATIGLATDGDADRVSAVDQEGIFYSPNKIASMLLRHLVKNKKLKGAVIRTLSTTHLMDHLAKKYNLEVIETKVGFKWICEEMRKRKVLIGAEESGGISILNHIPDKDGILTGMLLTEMLAIENKTLDQIYKATLKDAGWSCVNDRLDLHLNEKQIDFLISNLRSGKIKSLENLQVQSINTTEGTKYLFEDGSWFMVRASGTEPMARVYFEATSDKILELMKNTVQKLADEASCQR